MAACGGVVAVPEGLVHDEGQRQALARLARAVGALEPSFIVVEGPEGVGRRTAAALVAGRARRRAVAISAARVGTAIPAIEEALAGLRREALLTGALPVVCDLEEWLSQPAPGVVHAVARALDEFPVTVVGTASHAGLDLRVRRPVARIELGLPAPETRAVLWRKALGEHRLSDEDLEVLAARHAMGAGGIARAGALAHAQLQPPATSPTMADVTAGVRNMIADRLKGLAGRVAVRQSWDDLILPDDTLDQIRALVARVRHAPTVLGRWGFDAKLPHGAGMAAMFTGPPGTGKTMVAGLIARDLGLELYVVDLSQVVSKWIGETEKQLGRIFDAAEAGHALILFDEADALFAKRTEVKGATERYANLEVNYLLTRIEAFSGVAVLTTNLDTSIDPALRRRLAATVAFWPPELPERTRLWQSMLSTAAPMAADIDVAVLARDFPALAGGHIRNAAVAAAFLAAAAGEPIGQEHLLRAARAEYRSLGRVLDEAPGGRA